MIWIFVILFFLVMAFIAHANDKKAKQAAELQHSTLKVTIESEERVSVISQIDGSLVNIYEG